MLPAIARAGRSSRSLLTRASAPRVLAVCAARDGMAALRAAHTGPSGPPVSPNDMPGPYSAMETEDRLALIALRECWKSQLPETASEATKLFRALRPSAKTLETHNLMITGYAQRGLVEDMLKVYEELCEKFQPNHRTFASVLSALAASDQFALFDRYLEELYTFGLEPNEYIKTTQLSCYCKAGNQERVHAFLARNPELLQSAINFNVLLTHSSKLGHIGQVGRYYKMMRHSGIKPTAVTYGILISAFGNSKEYQGEVPKLLEEMKGLNMPLSLRHYQQLITICGRRKDVRGVMQYWHELKNDPHVQPDSFSYQLLFDQLSQLGQCDQLEECFNEMLSEGLIQPRSRLIQPRSRMYDSMFKALSNPSATQVIITPGSLSSPLSETPKPPRRRLTSKPGADFARLRKRFQEMRSLGVQPTYFTLHILIRAIGDQGDMNRMLQYLSEMEAGGFSPRVDTYNLVLGYFASLGQLSRIEQLVQQMEFVGLATNSKSYNALVRAYCRAQNFALAEHCFLYIQKQGVVVETTMFNTLLNAFVSPASQGYKAQCIPVGDNQLQSGVKRQSIDRQTRVLRKLGPGAEDGHWSWLHIWRGLQEAKLLPPVRAGGSEAPAQVPMAPDLGLVTAIVKFMVEVHVKPDEGTRNILDQALQEGPVGQACGLVCTIHRIAKPRHCDSFSKHALISLLNRVRREEMRQGDISAALLARQIAARLHTEPRLVSQDLLDEVVVEILQPFQQKQAKQGGTAQGGHANTNASESEKREEASPLTLRHAMQRARGGELPLKFRNAASSSSSSSSSSYLDPEKQKMSQD
eukprot:g38708.t1